MKKPKKSKLLDLREEKVHYPILSRWEPDYLAKKISQVLEANGEPVTPASLKSYAAILESDLQGSLGVPKKRRGIMKKQKQAKAEVEEVDVTDLYRGKKMSELPPELQAALLGAVVTTDEERMAEKLRLAKKKKPKPDK